MSKLTNSINIRYKYFTYLLRNLFATRKMQIIPTVKANGYIYSGLSLDQINALDDLHQILHKGGTLNIYKKTLLKYRGKILCGVVMDDEKNLLGYQLHSFQKNEIAHNILHIEFSGIKPQARNKRLSSQLRRHVACHYASQGLKTLSANVSKKNLHALKVAQHIGYKEINDNLESELFIKLHLDLSNYLD